MPMPRWLKKGLKQSFRIGDKEEILFLNRLWNQMRKDRGRR